jgi:hypothetical protein
MFAVVSIIVGEEHEERDFDVFGPKCWGMIGVPDEQLVSRSIMIQLLQKEKHLVVEDWPRHGLPAELSEMFLRLQRQARRWVQDNTEEIKSSMPELSVVTNRCKDNWFPLYCIACLAGDVWKERALQGAKAVSVIEELTPQIVLLRDIRNSFFTRGLDVVPSWLLLADLLLQPESPWKNYENLRDGLNSHKFGRMIRELGIESKTIEFDRQYVLFPKDEDDTTKLKGYRLGSFRKLIDCHLANFPPEKIPLFEPWMYAAERLKAMQQKKAA